VLFQVIFLSLLLQERGAGDLAQVAEHCRQKLIRRHPHVFGDAEVSDAAEVLRNWDAIKALEPGRERGVFGEVPENLPALLYARKLQRRAVSAGLHDRTAAATTTTTTDRRAAAGAADAEEGAGAGDDRGCFRDIGERLFALVDEARVAGVDPELALRAAARRFAEQIENGET
jgi:uncharacterized protein YabN with tetrapyrrole methylase and pyrophosphatase domain